MTTGAHAHSTTAAAHSTAATVMTLRVSAACEDGRKSCCNDEFFH